MEYGEHDLSSVLQPLRNGNGTFSESHIVAILYNLLSGLAFMHKLGLLHRDIKPNNILVSENCQVQIIDFGLSRNKPKSNKLMRLYRNKFLEARDELTE